MKILIKGYTTTLFDKETKEVTEEFCPMEKMGKKEMHEHLQLDEHLLIVDRKWTTSEYEISDELYNAILNENDEPQNEQ